MIKNKKNILTLLFIILGMYLILDFKDHNFKFGNFSNIEHIHNFSWYIGNYPTLKIEKLNNLLKVLNEI